MPAVDLQPVFLFCLEKNLNLFDFFAVGVCMRTKHVSFHTTFLLTLYAFLCMYMASVVTGPLHFYSLPCLVLIAGSYLLWAGDESFVLHCSAAMMLCLLATLLAVMIRRRYSLNLCFEESAIASLEGRVVYDSSFTERGSHLMKISLYGCTAVTGDSGSAKGIVSVLGDTQAIISYGVKVHLEGRFSDGLFIYDSIQVLSRGWLNDLREYIISWLQIRLLGSNADNGSMLSCVLLLGRADNCTMAIKDRAVSCGCAHVLALSGMHLGILANLCKRFFGGRRLSSVVSYVVIAAFVFVAGPRPSLVRSALAFILAFLPSRARIIAVFLVQMVFFPATMVELGCCYGYVAVFGIVLLSPFLEAAMFQFAGRLSTFICASLSVLVLCIPVQMASTGHWSPGVIVVSPLASLLAALSMVMGLLLLAFGRRAFLLALNNHVFNAMDRVFSAFEDLPQAGWVGYGVLLLCVALVFMSAFLLRVMARRKVDGR